MLVDWSQNNGNKTTIAPYSLRGRMRPTVAAPRTWRELASKDLRQLDYREVLKRVEAKGDPLAGLSAGHLSGPDRLAKYRGMRDAARTPEPVPTHAAPTSDGRSFVIQEHHARRLHFDFRLENDGVLVSWAVPKGIPTSPTRNNLAVQTEDHPLEYGEFEGTIPAGEYGAGEVTIWDSGTYDLEKWRENEEVIVILHGRPDGGLVEPVRVAMIHTGGTNWLMHRMKDQREGHWSRGSKAATARGTGTGTAHDEVRSTRAGATRACRRQALPTRRRGPGKRSRARAELLPHARGAGRRGRRAR